MYVRVYVVAVIFRQVPAVMSHLKSVARSMGLWNLFLTKRKNHVNPYSSGLTNIEYAPLCEILGRSVHLAPEATNCSAPDTVTTHHAAHTTITICTYILYVVRLCIQGNMEVLSLYGTPAQQEKWLKPLLNGEIRSCFGMTEPAVASSDATNIEASIERDGDEYVVNARKWWTSGNVRTYVGLMHVW